MPDGLGPNPFKRKIPPEEERKVPPTAVVEPPTEAPTEPQPIPPEGLKYTIQDEQGKQHELTLLEDFEYVGTERRLRSQDYLVFAEGKNVGRFRYDTGEFEPIELTFWQKVGQKAIRGIQWVFSLFTAYGMSQQGITDVLDPLEKQAGEILEENKRLIKEGVSKEERGRILEEMWARPVTEVAERQAMSAPEFLQAIFPGGEIYEPYRELPLLQQLRNEWPIWFAVSALGITATGARAALAPAAAKPGVVALAPKVARAILLPPAAVEWTTGKIIQYALIEPLKLIPKAGQAVFNKVLATGLDKKIAAYGRRDPKYQNQLLRWFMDKNNQWLVRKSTESLTKRLAEKKGINIAATTAAKDVLRDIDPLISVASKEFVPAVVPPTAVMPTIPTVAPTGITTKQWASFWIKTQGMGLTSAEVHEALGVASVKDWIAKGKTLEQALKVLPQMSEAHKIALDKALIDEAGKLSPQYRRLAQNITGKKTIDKMTSDEVNDFIVALDRYPDKKWSPKTGKWIAQTMPITTAMVPENYFGLVFKEPTPIKYFTSQNYYATKLGVGELTRPLEIAKQEMDLVTPAWDKAVDAKIKALNKAYKVTTAEKLIAFRNNLPTRASAEMATLLNQYETLPANLVDELGIEKVKLFSWFRNLSRTILKGENEVRELLNMPAIPTHQAYLKHIATETSKEIWRGNYSLPSDLAYWSSRIVGKKIFNPSEMPRKMTDDLLEYFSKDLGYLTKSMLHTGLKEIYLSQPLKAFTTQLNVLSKGMVPFSSLSPEEMAKAQTVSVLPASTHKWVVDYVNTVIKGQQTELDASINRMVTQSGIGGVLDKLLKEFGRSLGTRPITKLAQFSGRIVISATIGTKPRQIIRNLFQSTQNLALYGVEATLKGFLPAGKTLSRLLDRSMFLKSYARYEELPVGVMAKAERIWLWAYGKSAIFNARTGMKASYHGTIKYITSSGNKNLGWADPARTYTEPKGFLYDSEAEKLLREMEFGAGATQYQYIAMGMPEVFRHKTLIPFTRLQSWWMNYFAKFNREALHRFWNGTVGWDTSLKLPFSARLNWMKYLILGGAVLTALGYSRSFMKDVLPHWGAPATQFVVGAYSYVTADSDYKREQAKRTMYYSINAFVPGMIDYKSWEAVWTGEKPMDSLFFYGEDWEPDMPTWGIPPLVEEVAIKHAIKYANEEVPEFREKLGTLIPAEDDIESYTYEMADFAVEIRALIRDIPDERITEDNFSDITVMYKQAETLWDTYYYALPAGQRQAWLQQTTPESILTGAYLAFWGKLKVTGWVSGNSQTIALIRKLVDDYNIPPEAIPSLGEYDARGVRREEPTIEPEAKPREEGLGPNPFK